MILLCLPYFSMPQSEFSYLEKPNLRKARELSGAVEGPRSTVVGERLRGSLCVRVGTKIRLVTEPAEVVLPDGSILRPGVVHDDVATRVCESKILPVLAEPPGESAVGLRVRQEKMSMRPRSHALATDVVSCRHHDSFIALYSHRLCNVGPPVAVDVLTLTPSVMQGHVHEESAIDVSRIPF